jgi:Glycosyltransferase family 87
MQNVAASLRSKLPVLSALAIVLVALSVGVSLRGDLHGAWNMIRIPSNTPFFSDTRGFTHAIDCVLHGQDPYTVSTYDPWHRLYNYPPAWLQARHLGITSRSSNLIGIVLAALAICAYVVLFNARTAVSAAIVLLALTSRCVLLAVERGNTDQGVFFLLVLGFFLIDRQRPELRTRLTALLISSLTVIKLYPIAAVTVFLDRRRGALKTAITSLIALTALLLTTGAKLPLLLANTPRDPDMSFGAFPLFYSLTQHTFRSISPAIATHPGAAALAAIVLGLASMLAGVAVGDRIDRFLPRLRSDRPRGTIAIACLSIFCFAFAAGSSFDYRLIYLMGALAFLVEDINQGISLRSLPAAILILTLLWKPFWLSILGEVSDGLVFIMASAWLGNSLYRGQTEALAWNRAHRSFDPLRSRRSASA